MRQPQAFGPFEILDRIGGSMGVVHRARNRATGDEVALKILRRDRLLDGEARARFLRETSILATLQHPNLCRLVDSGEHDGIPYLAMPLLRGSTLAESRLRREGARQGRWRESAILVAKVARALDVAHGVGIVHRDLKPSNLFVLEDGEPIVIDFGLASESHAHYRELTRTGQVLGTPNYLAPEQIDPSFGPVDGRTDVYALGVVLYELLTGTLPFQAANRLELVDRILRDLPPDPRRTTPRLPADLCSVLDAAMTRRPKHRYASAAEFAADLEAVAAGHSARVVRPSVVVRVLRRMRDRAREVAVGTVLLAATVGVAWVGTDIAALQRELAASSERLEKLTLPARMELAGLAHGLLPPPCAGEVDGYEGWLAKHGTLVAAMADGTEGTDKSRKLSKRWMEDVELRRRLAVLFRERIGGEDASAWEKACRNVAADPRFAGFTLRPMYGLVPLGADPGSGLQEFYDLGSGSPELAVPERDAKGVLGLAEEHGIVFVLVPGGYLEPHDRPGVEVKIAPRLVGKHELTRAQFARLDFGNDPSRWPLGSVLVAGEVPGGRHPVDQVRLGMVLEALGRWGMGLPTQDEFEWLIRGAGAVSLEAGLAGVGNLAGGEDGFVLGAPVGMFPANSIGLHDLVGNVAELVVEGREENGIPHPCVTGCGWHFGGRVAGLGHPWVADQRYEALGLRALQRLSAR